MNKKDIENISIIISEAKQEKIPALDWWIRKLTSLDEKLENSVDYYVAYQEMENFSDEEFEKIMVKKFGNRWSTKKSVTKEDVRSALEEAKETAKRKFFPEEFKE